MQASACAYVLILEVSVDLNKYFCEVSKAMSHPTIRYGQALFNVFYDMYPEEANKIRGTSADPYYYHTDTERGRCVIKHFITQIVEKLLPNG